VATSIRGVSITQCMLQLLVFPRLGSEQHICLEEPYQNHDPDLSTTTIVHDAMHIHGKDSLYPIQCPFEHGRRMSFNNRNKVADCSDRLDVGEFKLGDGILPRYVLYSRIAFER
jgi:hypothetical protein